MDESTRAYQSVTLGLPPLKSVLGDIPSPDPVTVARRPMRSFGIDQARVDTKGVVQKLIVHIKDTK